MTHRSFDRTALDREYDNVGKVTPEFFQELMAGLQRASSAVRDRHRAALDIAYGSSTLERLDVFYTGKAGLPVHVFIHGGYWHALDKRDFSYIADGLIPHNIVTVVINYPLLPMVRMEAQITACRRALRWVYDHIEAYGGSPENISISGHSAGGHIAAMLLTDDDATSGQTRMPALEHACLISGIYDLEPIRQSFVNDILCLSVDEAARHSPVRLRPVLECSVAVVVGGDEGNEYKRQSSSLVRAWSQSRNAPSFSILEKQNHFTLRAQLGDPGSDVLSHYLLMHLN